VNVLTKLRHCCKPIVIVLYDSLMRVLIIMLSFVVGLRAKAFYVLLYSTVLSGTFVIRLYLLRFTHLSTTEMNHIIIITLLLLLLLLSSGRL